MIDQDLVANTLIRTPIDALFEMVVQKFDSPYFMSWKRDIVYAPETSEFLLSHGWTLIDYAIECSKVAYPTYPQYAFAQLCKTK